MLYTERTQHNPFILILFLDSYLELERDMIQIDELMVSLLKFITLDLKINTHDFIYEQILNDTKFEESNIFLSSSQICNATRNSHFNL